MNTICIDIYTYIYIDSALTIPQPAKFGLALKMIRTPKSSRKLNHNGPFENTPSIKNSSMYKPVHPLVKQVDVLVFARRGSSLKSTTGQTSVSSLLLQYYVDFIANLILVFGVITRQVIFVTMSTFAYNIGTCI